MGDLLTHQEQDAITAAGKLYGMITRICGDGRTRHADLTEAATLVHSLQHLVMAQAAARAYPETYRLLGDEQELEDTE